MTERLSKMVKEIVEELRPSVKRLLVWRDLQGYLGEILVASIRRVEMTKEDAIAVFLGVIEAFEEPSSPRRYGPTVKDAKREIETRLDPSGPRAFLMAVADWELLPFKELPPRVQNARIEQWCLRHVLSLEGQMNFRANLAAVLM